MKYPLAALMLPLAAHAANPIVADAFTADPAPLVVGDTVYLYAGQDEAPNERHGYVMNRWLCYSSKDLREWTAHGSPLKPTGTFKLLNVNSDKAIDVSGGSTADGAAIIQWPYGGAANQQWLISIAPLYPPCDLINRARGSILQTQVKASPATVVR